MNAIPLDVGQARGFSRAGGGRDATMDLDRYA